MQTQAEQALMIKGKRSKRPRPASPLSLTIATTSSTTAELSSSVGGAVLSDDVVSGNSNRVTPSPSYSGEVTADEEEEDMAKCLILLAKGQRPLPAAAATAEAYQCKTCSRSFVSFQALGGHRASHKKPNKAEEEKKPMRMREKVQEHDERETILSLQLSESRVLGSKCKVHECSICGAEFGSGQALGGHMRRHRPIPAASKKPRNLLSLDLNLPAPEDDHSESKFPFSGKDQQVIVFSASPNLIDCHY